MFSYVRDVIFFRPLVLVAVLLFAVYQIAAYAVVMWRLRLNCCINDWRGRRLAKSID